MAGNPELNLSEYDPREVKRAAKLALYNQDLAAFFPRELTIVTKDMGLRPFIPYPWQSAILADMQDQLATLGKIRQLLFKSRQPGGTTFSAGVVSRLIFLNPNVHAFVAAQDKTTVANIFEIYNTFYENLSSEIKPMRQYFTKGTEMVFANPNTRSRADDPGLKSRLIVGEGKNIHVGTGLTIHALHLSEISRYGTIQPIKDSLMPAFSDGRNTVGIIESTAHWAAGSAYFKSMCEKAMREEGDWRYHFIGWWLQPEYRVPILPGETFQCDAEESRLLKTYDKLTLENLNWRRKKLDDLDGDIYTFRMNYPFTFEEAWIPLGHSAFSVERLLDMKTHLCDPERLCEIDPQSGEMYNTEDGKLSIWHEPETGREYDIGADPAAGVEDGDWSVAEVVERGTNRQVAEWRGCIPPLQFADTIFHLGRYYNTAQVAPEVEKYGLVVSMRLQELNYPNIHIWMKRDTLVPKYTNVVGWSTTHNSKLILVVLAQDLIWNRQVRIYSAVLWEELMSYVRDVTPGGMHTYNAGGDSQDDAVMAWMIALRISKDEMAFRMEGTLQSKQEKISEKYGLDPAHYDAEGLRPVGTRSAKSEMRAW